MTFQELGLCPEILSALRDMGYEKPSPIQEKSIPSALAGRDVLGCAQTGTGKTCAFATPILQRLNGTRVKGKRPIRALILTPTRELALQIQESFVSYGKNLPLRSAVIFGGVGQQPQVDRLRAGVDILVATPGRLEDLHNQGYIHVEELEIFVLDEADRMLDMGFIHDVRKILKWLPRQKQTLFFSATMPPEVQHLVDELLTDPVKVAVNPVSSPVEVIDQKLYYVDRGNKSKLLASLVKEQGVKNALVFTRTKHGANKVANDLQKAGIPSAAIHGNKSQTARQQALADFKSGKVKALVATDIAARGLDIEELSHVFNYNLPDVPETYVHRIGRTGRAGKGGTAISFCEFGEKELLTPIEKLMKKTVPVVEGHDYPMEIFEKPKRDKNGKIINADDQEARQAARERKKERDAAKAQKLTAEKQVEKQTQPRTEQQPKAVSAVKERKGRGGTLESRYEQRKKPAAQTPQREKLTKKPDPATAERDAAFEAWLAEERAIQEKQARRYHEPLGGEEIMDATARFLAPKGGRTAEKPAVREVPQQERKQTDRGSKERRGGRAQSRHEAQKPQKQTEQKREQNKRQSPVDRNGKQGQSGGGKQAQTRGGRLGGGRQERSANRSGGRRGTTTPPRSNLQKDSTEQRSLMRPYYVSFDEE